jgi:HipA-like protein
MITKIINRIWKSEGMDYTNPVSSVYAEFRLSYGKNLLGILTFDKGIWIFKYSNEFIKSNLQPIIDFPDINKTYESLELWPFFAVRIPTLNQSYHFQKIKSAKIDKDDSVELLKLFGNETITNPFRLASV